MVFLEFPLFGSSLKLKKREKSGKITLGESRRINLRNSTKWQERNKQDGDRINTEFPYNNHNILSTFSLCRVRTSS